MPLTRRAKFEHDLYALIVRFGAPPSTELAQRVRACVDQMQEALTESTSDGQSLSPLDVVRIRAGKFAATCLPAATFRDQPTLAALRAEIHDLARAWLGPGASAGSRFPSA